MAYIAPIHQPSSVRHAIKLSLLAADEECLVVAKGNRLEIYKQLPDGLSLAYTRSVYGSVTLLNKIRTSWSETEHLFVGTDRDSYFLLSWDATSKQFKTEKTYLDQADASARYCQNQYRCLIDKSEQFMTLEVFEGIVSVIPIGPTRKQKSAKEPEILGDIMPIRISEFHSRSSTFFETRLREKIVKPKMAFLYEDAQNRMRIKIRQLNYSAGLRDAGSVDLEDVESQDKELDLGASHLIPIDAPVCGLVILGETSIMYFEHAFNEFWRRPLKDATIFISWARIDQTRFVLADEYGKLYLFMLEVNDQNRVEGWRIDVLGETSRASALVYLGSGTVFVGSHQGDSQVIQIRPQSLEILQTFPNVAPIIDFTIMDMGSRSAEGQSSDFSSGQARLVTGSGAFNDGSLRSIRSGVGLEDLGTLGEIKNITNVFALRLHDPHFESILLASLIDETRAFAFEADGGVSEALEGTLDALIRNESTLFATTLANGKIFQATSTQIRLIDSEGNMVEDLRTFTDQKITAVSSNGYVAVVTLTGKGDSLQVIDFEKGLQPHATKQVDAEIACVTVSPNKTSHCIVGFWHRSAISVLSLDTLATVHEETLHVDSSAIPRSLAFVDILDGQSPILFVGMADGNVVTFSVNPNTFAFSGRRSTLLGTQQAAFQAIPRDNGLYNLLAICEHPSLIYGSEGRIVYSAITAEDAVCVCPFNGQAYPDAIALATNQELKLATIDQERSTHVQAMPVGETVRRIAYSPELRAFGLGCIKRTLESSAEVVQSYFKLVDEVVFGLLDSYELNREELVESVMRCRLPDGSGKTATAERFVVGTAYLDNDARDSVRGRIIVFEVSADRSLKLIAEHATKGACRCLATIDGKIVAALVKTVVVYSFDYSAGTAGFHKVATYRTSTAPIDIAVEGTMIAITDLMKSVSLVEYKAAVDGRDGRLTEVARHFSTVWGTAVCKVDEDTYLESDAEGNLYVLHRDTDTTFAEQKRRLVVTSEIRLGELVNAIRPINVVSPQDAAVVPRAFLATTEGSIYLFGVISKSKQGLLMELQNNLAKYVDSPGHVPFEKFRAVRTRVREEKEPFRFVDGELLERFLDFDEGVQNELVKGLGVDVESVRGTVEGLRRLR